MKFKKKAVFLGVVIFLGLLISLPATRDELDWRYTESRDQAPDYMRYYTEWPKGRHVVEAKLRCDQRTWADTKRAMINEAIKKNTASQSDPEARKARKERLERFFWNRVTNENTIYTYKDYLMRYPAGQFAEEARHHIDDLTRQGAPDGSASTNSPGQ